MVLIHHLFDSTKFDFKSNFEFSVSVRQQKFSFWLLLWDYFLRLILRICWRTVRYLTYTLDLAILTFSNNFLFLGVIYVGSQWKSSVNVYCRFKALHFRNFTNILFLIAYHFLNQNSYSLLSFENVDFTNNLFMITHFRE